jgi:hypothetical protein
MYARFARKFRGMLGIVGGVRTLAWIATTWVGGCGLFPNLGNLDSLGGDASIDVAADSPVDSAGDAAVDAGSDAPVEAGPCAPTDASFAFVSSMGNYDPNPTTSLSLGTTGALAGDLVVIGCDTQATAGAITLDAVTAKLAPHVVGPVPDSTNVFEEVIFWGVLASTPPGGGAIAMTATPFLDCSINLYRGGTPSAAVVSTKETDGVDASELVKCGPVDAVAGGLAYYIAVRYVCAGVPQSSPFVQRQDLEGNPNGDVVPTPAGMLATSLAACGSSASNWECLTIAMCP